MRSNQCASVRDLSSRNRLETCPGFGDMLLPKCEQIMEMNVSCINYTPKTIRGDCRAKRGPNERESGSCPNGDSPFGGQARRRTAGLKVCHAAAPCPIAGAGVWSLAGSSPPGLLPEMRPSRLPAPGVPPHRLPVLRPLQGQFRTLLPTPVEPVCGGGP